jgi:hypothetical protein
MRWLKGLKLFDGYAAGLRQFMIVTIGKLTGVMSHDYDIIMERLLPIMIQGYLDDVVWMLL